jgi:hypothetical protein
MDGCVFYMHGLLLGSGLLEALEPTGADGRAVQGDGGRGVAFVASPAPDTGDFNPTDTIFKEP